MAKYKKIFETGVDLKELKDFQKRRLGNWIGRSYRLLPDNVVPMIWEARILPGGFNRMSEEQKNAALNTILTACLLDDPGGEEKVSWPKFYLRNTSGKEQEITLEKRVLKLAQANTQAEFLRQFGEITKKIAMNGETASHLDYEKLYVELFHWRRAKRTWLEEIFGGME